MGDVQRYPQRNGVYRDPVDYWESGPMLITDSTNYAKSMTEIPGEGKIYNSREDGSRIWKHKTRRKYYEISPKPARTIDNKPDDKRRMKAIADVYDKSSSHRVATDDEKLVSAEEQDDMLLRERRRKYESRNNESRSYEPKSYEPRSYEKSYDLDSDQYLVPKNVPTVRDVGIQCNRKKSNKHLISKTNNSFTIIKPTRDGYVSAYSNVPQIDNDDEMIVEKAPPYKREILTEINHRASPPREVIYSQIDKSKKKSHLSRLDKYEKESRVPYSSTLPHNKEKKDRISNSNPRDYLRYPREPPKDYPREYSRDRYSSPDASYSVVPNKTLKSKTTGFGFSFKSGVDGPEIKLPRTPSPSHKAKGRSASLSPSRIPERKMRARSPPPPVQSQWYQKAQYAPDNSLSDRRKVPEEIIEETISISNASSDEMINHNRGTDIDEITAPKSIIKEIDRSKKRISYENVSPRARPTNVNDRDIYDGAITNGGGLWFRSLQEDYRCDMAQNEVSRPGLYADERRSLAADETGLANYSTLSRLDSKKKETHADRAYTLDRRHLEERKKRNVANNSKHVTDATDHGVKLRFREYASQGDLTSSGLNPNLSGSRSRLTNAYKHGSARDLTSNGLSGSRGGLAEAYKARQPIRATMLSRLTEGEVERHNPVITRSQSEDRGMKYANSLTGSYTANNKRQPVIHDREPIVMYIPAVSHHDRRAEDETDRLSGIIKRSHSVSSSKKPKIKKVGISSGSSDISTRSVTFISRPRTYDYNVTPNPNDEMDQSADARDEQGRAKGKDKENKGVSRRHSMPKDAKLPWFHKLKFTRSKIKSKE